MSIADPTRRYDGFNDISSGMDGGRTPESIGPQNAALLVNASVRGGWAHTRPTWMRRGLSGTTSAVAALCTGFFQGAAPYYNPATGARALLVVVSGRLYEINVETFGVRDLTPDSGPNSPRLPCYFCQAESFVVVQNGFDPALIYDGDTSRQAGTDEVPRGTLMAYGQGRLFVASPDRRELVAGDLVYGGSLTQVAITISHRTTPAPAVSATTTFTTATPHGFTNGDRVDILQHSSYKSLEINAQWEIGGVTATTFTIPLSVSRDGVGGFVQKFGAGREADLLRFTETTYLNEKGVFRLPAYMGRITGMTFFPVQDTATGQGDLMVFGEHGCAGFSISLPRERWLDSPLQRVALAQIGASGPNAIVSVNSDVFFRSDDGLRTYRTASTDFLNTYGQTPVSFEMARVMSYDSPNLLDRVSAGLFDNQLLFTVSPREAPELDGDPFAPVPVVFGGVGVLDFNNSARVSSKSSPAYNGLWTGLDILQLVAARFAGVGRAFLFSFTPDRCLDLWEITTRSETGTDISDKNTRLAFVADAGYDSAETAAVAAMVKAQGATDLVLAGDLNYEDGLASTMDANIGKHWRAFMYPFHGDNAVAPLKRGEVEAKANHCFVCPGNHDWDFGDDLTAFRAYTNAPGNYYSKRLGDLELFFLDSDVREPAGTDASSTQHAWAVAAIAASTARWKGVVLHHSPHTSGNTNGATAALLWVSSLPVHFVVGGHEHNYERLNVGGVIHFVVGTGGVLSDLYGFGTLDPASLARVADTNGALLLDVLPDSLAFSFRDTAGRELDAYTLTNPDDEDALVRTTRTERKIQAALETRAFPFESPFSQKKLVRGDLWLSDLLGSTDFRVFWRPDVHPYWFYWGEFSKFTATDAWVAGVLTTTLGGDPAWTPQALFPALSPQIRLPTPPRIDDAAVVNRPANLGFTFQIRLEWDGRAEIQKLILHALDIPEAAGGSCPGADTTLRTVRGQGATVPAPTVSELLAHSSR